MTARILVLDIETSPNLAYVWGLFKQDISLSQLAEVGQVISFAAKWHDEKRVIFHSDHHDGHEAMIEAAWTLLDEADVVVHWNGTSFDIPWLNREFTLAGMSPPSPFKEVDLCQQVRRIFRFTSNKLDHVAQQLGVGKKVGHAGFGLWLACMSGDEKAWNVMRRYNIGDARITDGVYVHLKPWLKHPHVGLFATDASVNICGRCGSSKLQRRGRRATALGVFQQFQCQGCGGWSRGGKRLDGVDVRPV